jgi:hypothetical protein
MLKRLARDKQSNVLCQNVNIEEKSFTESTQIYEFFFFVKNEEAI